MRSQDYGVLAIGCCGAFICGEAKADAALVAAARLDAGRKFIARGRK